MAAPDTPAGTAGGKTTAPKRSLIMRHAARSDVGRVRAKNDDSAYVGRHLAVVADGMGGHAGGDVASAATVLDMIHLDHDNYDGDGDAGTVLADEIQTANSLLSELVHINPKLAGMGTTVTALLLAEGKLHFAHIGDSRAYRLRNGEFEQISVDHTFVQRLIDEGRLRPEEAETHPHKNVLMRVLGDVDASPELDLGTLDVEPGERWLLCSDGLNYVAGHVVERTVRETKNLRECVDHLVDLTLEAGAPDNVTVVMIEIVEQGPDDVSTATVQAVPAPAAVPAAAVAAAAGAMGTGTPRSGNSYGAALASADPGSRADAGQPEARSPDATTTPALDQAVDEAAGKKEPATDPHLGEHLSAVVLREELSSRPHELVGAAAAAAESGSIPSIAGRTVARRAATVLTHKSEQAREEAEYVPAGRPRRWLTVAVAAAIAVLVAIALALGYAWTQTRYYIGEHDQHVAIFNGVSQRLGPVQLSTLETVTPIRMSDLSEYSRQRVRQTLPARDLYDAQQIVKNLERDGSAGAAGECPSPPVARPAEGSAATPTPTASAEAQPSAAPTPSPVCEGAK